jgi:hypothetical protein
MREHLLSAPGVLVIWQPHIWAYPGPALLDFGERMGIGIAYHARHCARMGALCGWPLAPPTPSSSFFPLFFWGGGGGKQHQTNDSSQGEAAAENRKGVEIRDS